MAKEPHIPIIDFAGTDEAALAEQIRAACLNNGFFYLTNHGLDEDLLRSVFEQNQRFHDRPLAEKQAIKLNHWHRGYQGLATSKLVSSARFAPAKSANQLASFFLRQEVSPDDPDYLTGAMKGPNQWPEWSGGAEFQNIVRRYDTAVRALAMSLLPAIALAVGEGRNFFLPYFQNATTALRLIHYPPVEREPSDDAYGIHPHTDYGFITILAQDQTGGLELQTPSSGKVGGGWIPAPPVPGTLIINIGDAMARWTNDTFNSTPHRVISPSSRASRYSVAMFFDPDVDAEIRCLNQFTNAANPVRHPAIRYGDYLSERLNANYPDRVAGVMQA